MDIYINSSSAPISSTDSKHGGEEVGGWGGRRREKVDERGGAPVICVKWCGIMRNIWGLIS